jgi:hypothetical protein
MDDMSERPVPAGFRVIVMTGAGARSWHQSERHSIRLMVPGLARHSAMARPGRSGRANRTHDTQAHALPLMSPGS